MSLERPGPIATWPLRLVERSDPSPGSAEILVRVRVCGVCRTDLHVIEGDLPPHRLPLVPGHQAVGVVEAVGRDCRRLARGERVGIPWLRGTCGGCPACRDGRENLCPGSVYSGYDEDGGYAELALVSEAITAALAVAYEFAPGGRAEVEGVLVSWQERRRDGLSGTL